MYISRDLVEGAPDVDGAVLNDSVDGLRDGSGEVRVGKLRVEEDLWTKEPLVPHIHRERLSTHTHTMEKIMSMSSTSTIHIY